MWQPSMTAASFSGALNYVNACPNQPEPGRVFCADHCQCADSKRDPTSMKEFTMLTSRIEILFYYVTFFSMVASKQHPNWMNNKPLKTAAADCQGKSCTYIVLCVYIHIQLCNVISYLSL